MEAWEHALELMREVERWWATPTGILYSLGWTKARAHRNTSWPEIGLIERSKLAVAAPFYVTREMTDLLEHAAETFPETSLHPSDIPVDAGFVLLGSDIDVTDIHLKPLPFRVFTWRLMNAASNPEEAFGIHLSTYAHKDNDPQRNSEMDAGIADMHPTLSLIHETGWNFGTGYAGKEDWTGGSFASEGKEIPEEAHVSGIHMMRVIHSFFMLVQQRIGESRYSQVSRPVRRRESRFDPDRPIPEVRVITLRKRRVKTEAGETLASGIEYSHRWWVNGHWRHQWYPSEGRHKPKYIDGYVKGPEDKPFQAKDTAYVWRR